MLSSKKKKSKSQELFEDLVIVRKELNRLKASLEKLDRFDEDYQEKKQEVEAQMSDLFEIREVIEEQMLRDNGDIFIGVGYEIKNIKTEEPKLVPVVVESKNRAGHFSGQGTTRVGKTVLMLNGNVRQNLRAKENVIVIDPKGGQDQEVFSAMVEFAYESEMLYFFKYFSLAYPDLSDRINPFFGMGHEERASLVASISSIGNSEQFFTDVVYQLTYAVSLCFEVIEVSKDPYGTLTQRLIENEYKKNEYFRQNKGFMREMINKNADLKSPDGIDIAFSEESDDLLSVLEGKNSTLMTFRDLARFVTYAALEELKESVFTAQLPESLDDPSVEERIEQLKDSALMEMGKILEQPKEFYTKISVSLATLLTQMSQGAIGSIFCSSRINPMLNDLSDENKRLVALIHPFPLRFKKISDMSSRIFMLTIENMLGRVGSTGRGFNARVNFHVDEAASVAYPGIERLPAQAGGLGVYLYFYTQSFADWVKALGSEDAANIMLDNLNNQARFRMKDEKSARRVVDELGQVDIISSSAMVESDGAARMMMNSEERWFAKTSDVLKLAIGRIIFTTGEKSYLVDTPFWRGPKGSIVMPEISVEKNVKKIREIEKSMMEIVNKMASVKEEATV
jgi:hypothetical protein